MKKLLFIFAVIISFAAANNLNAQTVNPNANFILEVQNDYVDNGFDATCMHFTVYIFKSSANNTKIFERNYTFGYYPVEELLYYFRSSIGEKYTIYLFYSIGAPVQGGFVNMEILDFTTNSNSRIKIHFNRQGQATLSQLPW